MQAGNIGVLYMIGTYVFWGFMPVYWKFLAHVSSEEILAGRIMWSFVLTLLLVLVWRQGPKLVQDLRQLWHHPKSFWSLCLASILISGNWFIYIWAVNNGHILQTSLGYYINPLMSVLLGVFFLKEKLSSSQKIAFVLATIGVVLLTYSYGVIPWVSLGLAASFAVYSLLKKQIDLDALRGLTIETFFIFPIAVIFCIWLYLNHEVAFLHVDLKTDLLLIGTGFVTAIPLLMFAKGVKLVPLYAVGFFQYISPTIMLVLGVFVYHESFGKAELFSFSFIWAALLLFTVSKVYEFVALKRSEI